MVFFRFTQYGLGSAGMSSCGTGPATGGYDVASSGMDGYPGGTGMGSGSSQRTSLGVVSSTGSAGLAVAPDRNPVSAVGGDFQCTPSILPVRGHLDSIRRLRKGDLYIGRGCRQRGLCCSKFANPFKVAKFERGQAIVFFAKQLDDDRQLQSALWIFSDCA